MIDRLFEAAEPLLLMLLNPLRTGLLGCGPRFPFPNAARSSSVPSWLLMTTFDDDRPGTKALALVFSRAAGPEPGRFPCDDVDGVGGGEVRPLIEFECEWEGGG